MLEMLGALLIATLMLVGYLYYQSSANATRRNQSAAEHAKMLIPIVRNYINANQSALLAAAGPNTPVTITPAQLVAGANLNASAVTNAFGQTFVVRVIEPASGKLDALVLYTGGSTVDQSELIDTAGLIGFAGGYVSTADPSTAFGWREQWRRSLAAFGGNVGTGKVVISIGAEDAQQIDDYLHRSATAGKPELNRMSTSIDMSGNNISNISTAQGVNLDASNGVQANQVSIGKAAFGSLNYPYETYQVNGGLTMRFALGSSERLTIGSDNWSRFSGNVSATGDHSVAGNSFVSGSITANGRVNANDMAANEYYANGWFRSQGNGGWYSQQYGGGIYMSDSQWIRLFGDKGLYTGGQVQAGSIQSNGTLQVNGRATVNEFIQINGVVGVGNGCSPNGLLAIDSSGQVVSCTSGVWRTQGLSQSQIVTATRNTGGGSCTGQSACVATCPAGTYLGGGGYQTVTRTGSSHSSPEVSMPNGNTWYVWPGQSSSGTVFWAHAVCLK